MASDLDEPLKFSRNYQEFTLEGGEDTSVAPEENTSEAADVGLSTILSGANALMRARREGRIGFAPGVTAVMLETMGVLLMRAAHTSNARREALFQHWLADGLPMVDDLIEKVEARQSRMLMPEDLASMFMGKPPGY